MVVIFFIVGYFHHYMCTHLFLLGAKRVIWESNLWPVEPILCHRYVMKPRFTNMMINIILIHPKVSTNIKIKISCAHLYYTNMTTLLVWDKISRNLNVNTTINFYWKEMSTHISQDNWTELLVARCTLHKQDSDLVWDIMSQCDN